MSKRTPFVFSFESPYELTDTVRTFRDVLCDVYAAFAGCDEDIVALKPGQSPPLTHGIYVPAPTTPHSPGHDCIELVVGNRAKTYWAATITFAESGGRTCGEVNLDRPKRELRESCGPHGIDDYLALRDLLPSALSKRLGFIIPRMDFS